MQVYLVRHAEALAETIALRDPHRHLTPHGRDQARSLGERLRWHDCSPTYVLTSPLVRAVQTAELVVGALGEPVEVDALASLVPDGNARDVQKHLAMLPAGSEVMLFGHEPLLSGIGAVLTGDHHFMAIDKACAVRIDDGKVRWRFAWNAEAPITATR